MADLQKSLDKLKERIESNMPKEAVAIMHQATKELQESSISNEILKTGSIAQEFSLQNQNGKTIKSADLLKSGPLIITFYRGVWCPYCNKDLSYLNKFTKTFEEKGATTISISPQLPEFNKQIVEQQHLSYDLLSDLQNNVADSFGLKWTMKDPLQSLYNSFGINLPKYNGDESWTLPIPARFIINPDGKIVYSEFSIDYTQRPNPDVLLEHLN